MNKEIEITNMEKILFGKPVPPQSFVSRGDCVTKIERLIQEGRNIELIGPNRIGKTALCRYIANKLKNDNSADVSYVDLLHLKAPRIGGVVSKVTGSGFDNQSDDELDEFVGANQLAVNALVEYAQSISSSVVIIVDEMDAGLQRKGIYHEWNASLRMLESVFFEKGIENVSFIRVLTSHPDYYENIHLGHVISKSIGGGYIIEVPALTDEQAKELFTSLVSNQVPVDAEFAIRYAGRYPFLIDCLAYEAQRLIEHDSNFKTLLEHVYRQSSSFYKGLFEFVERKDNYQQSFTSTLIAIALIQAKSYKGPIVDSSDSKFDLDEMEKKELISIGLLTRNGTNYELFSPLFAWWISRHAVSLLQEENELSKKLISYFGVNDLKTLLANIKNAQAI
ncbi:AAA family ATPase, partial [Methylobacter sp. BBA5.1]|uniref:AAA family ATPase n=1 Tax=Methylobacter sp. BBA5.1 TaxID=1495064 RepID=UPI001267EF49